MQIPQTPTREKLDVYDDNFDSVATVPGVDLVSRINLSLEHNFDCKGFVFPDNPETFPAGYEETSCPVNGSLAVYYDVYGDAVHFGFFQDGRIKSKWGRGHIFLHDITAVPSYYGCEVRFYRKKK